MFMNSKMLFIIATLGMSMSAIQTAHASEVCRDAAIACGGFATGSLLICAAAAAQEAANPIADIACSDLANAGRASCVTMAIACAPRNGSQPATVPLSVVGASSATVDETKFCKGSHRVTGLSVWVQNNYIRKIAFTCSNGLKLNTGPTVGTSTSKSCSSGRMAQGSNVLMRDGNVTGFELQCDNAFTNSTVETQLNLGSMLTRGSRAIRMCAEGSYLVGYRAFHSGSTGYLKGIELICRGLPK